MSDGGAAKVHSLHQAQVRERDIDLWVIGLNHTTAPVELREKFAIEEESLGTVGRQLLEQVDLREVVVLSTCNRVEIVGVSPRGSDCIEAATACFAANRGLPTSSFTEHRYSHRGWRAVRHLFRVASSLDSMVVGEPQILGQLKQQYRIAADEGISSRTLRRCFESSFRVAKRVRTETGVATKSVSVSSAAVDLARRIFDDLGDKTAMLIGAGKMSELAARHLLSAGIDSVIVTNRSFDRAVELAREFDGTPVPFERFPQYLHLADVVLGSVSAGGHVLGPSQLSDVLRARRRRPMFFIDLGVPRNFDPALNDLQNVYLYNIDDLARVSDDHRAERAREAESAEQIVRSEAEVLWRALSARDVTPTIVALRDKLNEIREGELERALSLLDSGDSRDRRVLDAMSQAIVNKILHSPTQVLKAVAHEDEDDATEVLTALRRLFELDFQEGSMSDESGED